ncbi:chemotaxis protein [Streptomyces sp. A3M-1-3]|uniref:baeRF3 domain-containing protein n=1 Tax=Streptomyces sp. A3M-1-3 TaxID=2962044 RepID=UPI0020B7DCC8|nr:chemotaxis protein [Streptomyces sp. A3M-1-3]MCP3822636.1 chemotaxis protein [Streptomyces sp. A3M-1-3]
METDALTPALLQILRTTKPYPVVSLTMPTHRREPENAQDGVRLRNLVAEAGRRLAADTAVDRQTRIDITTQLDQAMAELDLRHALDGLTIFAGPDEYQIWSLPRRVPERVVLSDTYLTRNLVAAKAQALPYWVLVVAADHATLWNGSGETLREHSGNGFPLVLAEGSADPQREERQGDVASTFSDERTRQFMRSVDAALGSALGADPRPLYLVGLAPALALLGEVGTASRAAAGTVLKGGLSNGPAHVLHKELQPALTDHQQQAAEQMGNRLDEARSRRSFAAGLDEVWEAVRAGRAGLVAVEEHFQQTVRVDGEHLVPVDAAGSGSAVSDPQVREDIVDELVEAALESGAEVVFLPHNALAEHDRIAADLRY